MIREGDSSKRCTTGKLDTVTYPRIRYPKVDGEL
jgi:hypothetical protein